MDPPAPTPPPAPADAPVRADAPALVDAPAPAKRPPLDRGVIAILVAGLLLSIAYLTYTRHDQRNYDPGPQLEYIEFVLWKHKRPPAFLCMVCHHPPFYYLLAAGAYAFFTVTKLCSPQTGLQIVSLGIFSFFQLFGVLTVARFVKSTWLLRLTAALLVFWPYSVINSVRVHNDTLVCTFMAVALYYVVAWYQDDRPRDLRLAGVFIALAILTKSSGLLVLFVLLILIARRLLRARDRKPLLRRAAVVVALSVAALGLASLGKSEPPPGPKRLCNAVLGSACYIDPKHFVENTPGTYLTFDLRSYLDEPFMFATKDGSGREHFWNHLLKSSLFGTSNRGDDEDFNEPSRRAIGKAMNVELLALLGCVLAGLVAGGRRLWASTAPLLLLLGVSLAFMVVFRAWIPSPHHSDLRHVYPVVIPMCTLYGLAIEEGQRRARVLGILGYLLAGSFVVLSIAFFLPRG